MQTKPTIDQFTLAYIECALWSSTDDDGEPLDGLYSIDDLAPETIKAMRSDCADFQATFGELIQGRETQAAHDFWLTRNRHGAGFWDGDWRFSGEMTENDEPKQIEDIGTYLTEMSHAYGEANLYVGDDGLIYQS